MAETLESLTDGEARAVVALFADDDAELTPLRGLLRASQSTEKAEEEELEALMREHFGLARVDLDKESETFARAGERVSEVAAADDYTDEEWVIVSGMRNHCRRAIRTGTSERQRAREVRWLFIRGDEDDKGLSFHLACEALSVRPFVVQTMVQHYWGMRQIVVPPFPFLADPLPDPLLTECLYHAGTCGGQIGGVVWSEPGIALPELQRRIEERHAEYPAQYEQALADLQEAGLVQVALGRAHFISRRPITRRSRRQSWARTFQMED